MSSDTVRMQVEQFEVMESMGESGPNDNFQKVYMLKHQWAWQAAGTS